MHSYSNLFTRKKVETNGLSCFPVRNNSLIIHLMHSCQIGVQSSQMGVLHIKNSLQQYEPTLPPPSLIFGSNKPISRQAYIKAGNLSRNPQKKLMKSRVALSCWNAIFPARFRTSYIKHLN